MNTHTQQQHWNGVKVSSIKMIQIVGWSKEHLSIHTNTHTYTILFICRDQDKIDYGILCNFSFNSIFSVINCSHMNFNRLTVCKFTLDNDVDADVSVDESDVEVRFLKNGNHVVELGKFDDDDEEDGVVADVYGEILDGTDRYWLEDTAEVGIEVVVVAVTVSLLPW